jgi:hypothetical protein
MDADQKAAKVSSSLPAVPAGRALAVRAPEAWTRAPPADAGAAFAGDAPGADADRLLATQLLAAHHAAMASYRGARDEPCDHRRRHAHLTQACRFSRTFIRLFDRLDRRRASARPTVTVLHVRRTATEQGRSRGLPLAAPAKSEE